MGGPAIIGIIGEGETLIPDKVVPFVHGLLEQGHFVEVVTNMSLTHRIDELLDTSKENLKRLLVKGSLHWNELKRLNKIDDYFNNINKVIEAGASSYPFLVISQDYLPFLDEIKTTCLEKLGELPHCTGSLVFDNPDDIKNEDIIKTCPECTPKFNEEMQEKFDSKIYDLFVKFLHIKPTSKFCYAGEWSFIVNLATGDYYKCHFAPSEGDMFKKPQKTLNLTPIGHNCKASSCSLQYNFLSQGLVPEFKNLPNYSELLDKKRLLNDTARKIFDFKYYDYLPLLSKEEEKSADEACRYQFEELNYDRNKLSFKNRIRYDIWKYLDKKLRKKGML